MTDQNQSPHVYSYLKFKELADDRMSQVKIFIQNSEEWEPSGFGMLHFFQISPANTMKELPLLADFDSSIKNLYALIESSEVQNFSETEITNLRANSAILNPRNIKIQNVIAVYDFYNGLHFDFDFESSIKRKSDQLDSQKISKPASCNELRV